MFKLQRSILISSAVGAFLIGLWLGHQYLWQVSLGLIGAAVIATILARKSRLLLAAVIALGLALGIYRGHQSLSTYTRLESMIGHETTLIGEVMDDPARSDTGYLNFSLNHLQQQGRPIPGQIRVRTYYVKLQRGYMISAAGKLQPTIGNKQAEFGFATTQVISTKQSWLEHFRQRFLAGIRTSLPEPLAAFGLGLLIGTRALISKNLQDALTLVGLSHVVAVSGYNLTIIVNAVRRPLGKVSKFFATAVTLWLILGFVVVAGFSASIIRAALVSTLSLLAVYYGRKIRPMVLISLAAGATAAFRPDYLWSDVGWQLSFLAFFGIMVLAPALEARFIKNPNGLKSLLLQSFSAQIITFPLILLVFGRLSVVSPLTNLIVLPLVPLAMLLSFIAGLSGMLMPIFSGWLAWPASFLLRLILAIIDWFAAKPWSSVNLGATPFDVIGFYGLVILVLLLIIHSTKRLRALEPVANTKTSARALRP